MKTAPLHLPCFVVLAGLLLAVLCPAVVSAHAPSQQHDGGRLSPGRIA